MKLEYIPLLQIQRHLQGMPRDRIRFEAYLRTMSTRYGAEIELVPLLMANPMAQDHVTAALDTLIALDADAVAAHALEDAAREYEDRPGEFKAGLVVVDDLRGGWTNRYSSEFGIRNWYSTNPHRFWVTGVLWSSEPPSLRAATESLLTALHRTVLIQERGLARNLGELLIQEGQAMARAGCTGPTLDDEEIDYTHEVIRPFLGVSDMRTSVECLFGDEAARSLGFTPRGLSHSAGLAVALHDALRSGVSPRPLRCGAF